LSIDETCAIIEYHIISAFAQNIAVLQRSCYIYTQLYFTKSLKKAKNMFFLGLRKHALSTCMQSIVVMREHINGIFLRLDLNILFASKKLNKKVSSIL